ncbi:MAG: transposase [Dehalococcoidia bacterium]
MYQELLPLRQSLQEELRATLPLDQAGVDPDKLLDAYLDQLTLYVGVDVANKTLTAVILDARGEVVDTLTGFANAPDGFERFRRWVERVKARLNARLVAVAREATGIYGEEFWLYLKARTDYARMMFNPRTTEHMGEVLSKKVRDEVVDAYLISEQLRLGSTPECRPSEEEDLLFGRECSRIARDTAKEITRKKNQYKAYLRGFNPALYRRFPGQRLYHQAVYALIRSGCLFPEDLVTAGMDQVATTLAQNSGQRFGLSEAQALVRDAQQCYSRPGRRQVIRQRVLELIEDIQRLEKRQKAYVNMGYAQIAHRPVTGLIRQVKGAGPCITLAVVTELGDPHRFLSGAHMASFLGLTTSKHISGTTLYRSKRITKMGPPNGRYAVVKWADYLRRYVPFYRAMYQRIKGKKPPHKGHFVANVAIGRHFVTEVLYDMMINERPFFVEVEDYREYRQHHQDEPA